MYSRWGEPVETNYTTLILLAEGVCTPKEINTAV